jgi:hypothetical protein
MEAMNADETARPRPTGEAAWRAHRDAIEQRNAATKRDANPMSASDRATLAREHRLAKIEAAQIRKLNSPKS